jgi:hypothetical protein
LKILFPNVLSQKSLYIACHSGLDPESSLSNLDSRFRGNDSSPIIVNPLLKHRTNILWKGVRVQARDSGKFFEGQSRISKRCYGVNSFLFVKFVVIRMANGTNGNELLEYYLIN